MYMWTQEAALKIVACLRSGVEERLHELKTAKDINSEAKLSYACVFHMVSICRTIRW